MKYINNFLWLCSGANKSTLKRCPSEGSKYAGIGATVLFTGLLAGLAGGYALHTVFQNVGYSIGFGVLWGGLIFNLDRYLVSGMKKSNSRKEVQMTMPRILLALLIAIVISKPLELRIFENEIQSELIVMQQEILKVQEGQIADRYTRELTTLNNEIDVLKAEIDKQTQHRDHLVDLARQEADGTGGSMQRNAGPIYNIKKQNADKAEIELQQLISKNAPLITQKQKQLEELRSKVGLETSQLPQQQLGGLASRLEALARLKEKSVAIRWADWFIFLLFVAIETSPILVKLISSRGPYDELIEAHEHTYKVRNATLIAKQSAEARNEHVMLDAREKEFLHKKLLAGLK